MYQGLIRSVKESPQALPEAGKAIDRGRRKEQNRGRERGREE